MTTWLTTLNGSLQQLALSGFILSSLWLLPACVWLSVTGRYGPGAQSWISRSMLLGLLILPLAVGTMQSLGMSRGFRWPQALVRVDRAKIPRTVEVKSDSARSELPLASQRTEPIRFDEANPEPEQLSAVTTVTTDSIASNLVAASTIDWWSWTARMAVVLWLACALVLLTRIARSWLMIGSLVRTSTPDLPSQVLCQRLASSLRIARPRVVRSPWIHAPCQAGIVRPVILLPVEDGRIGTDLDHVLLHELAHIGRRDVLWNLLFQLAVAVLPFQPLLWWLRRRHEIAAEQACDDFVVQNMAQPTSYAQLLLDLASQQLTLRSLGVGMVARPSLLGQRIKRILSERCDRERTLTSKARALLTTMLTMQCCLASWLLLPIRDSQVGSAEPTFQANADNDAKASRHDWLIVGQVFGVDGLPASGAIVECSSMKYWNFKKKLLTDAHGKFSLKLNRSQARIWDLRIVARSADANSLIFAEELGPGLGTEAKPLVLKLQPKRSVELQVIDQANQPVSMGQAALHIGGSILTSTTDARGIARFTVPESQNIFQVAAWKDDVGFDFVEFRSASEPMFGEPEHRRAPPPREFPASGTERLQLSGAKKVIVFVADEEGQPLRNMNVRVGQFVKPNGQSYAISWHDELSSSSTIEPTDAAGRTQIACIPTWHQGSIEIWCESKQYETRHFRHPMWSDETVRIQLAKKVSLSGRVTDAAGKPVGDVVVRAAGDTYSISQNEASTITDPDGRYEMLVPPRHVYLVGVQAESLAAPAQIVMLDSERSANNVDFQLKPANRIRGRVINQADSQPVADASVIVHQYGPRDRSANTALPKEYADKPWNAPLFLSSQRTDAAGRFEFLLGEGDFAIFNSSPRSLQQIEFRSEPDLELKDIEVNAGEQFTATVLKDGKPLAGAVAEAWTMLLEGWNAQSDSSGKFSIRRPRGQTAIRVTSADGKYGAIHTVVDESSMETTLRALGIAKGRLVSATGQPLALHSLGYAVRFRNLSPRYPPAIAPSWYCFGEAVTTNERGEFELTGLVPDQEYTLSFYPETEDRKSLDLKKLKVQPGQLLELGEVRIP